jgi:hypothetical protein
MANKCKACKFWKQLPAPDRAWGSCTRVSRPDHPNTGVPFTLITDELTATSEMLTFGDLFHCQQYERRLVAIVLREG